MLIKDLGVSEMRRDVAASMCLSDCKQHRAAHSNVSHVSPDALKVCASFRVREARWSVLLLINMLRQS